MGLWKGAQKDGIPSRIHYYMEAISMILFLLVCGPASAFQ
jgi:hypothetical protein